MTLTLSHSHFLLTRIATVAETIEKVSFFHWGRSYATYPVIFYTSTVSPPMPKKHLKSFLERQILRAYSKFRFVNAINSPFTADGEVWGEKLAFSEEFLNRLDSVPMRLQEKFPEPPSPVKIQRPSITSSPNFDIDLDMEMCALPEVNFDDSFDDSRYRSALEFPDLKDDDSHSILEVPDCDSDNDDMSFGNDTVDNSILHDW